MAATIIDKKKLQANYSVYIKIAEREFLEKNFTNAYKSFKKAYEIAKELNSVEDCIKILDTQASCQEQLGNISEAINLATKLISNHKSSPVGYLRMGKLLRLQKEVTEADKFYKIGLVKSDKNDKLYEVLEKQHKNVQKILQSITSTNNIEEGKEQIYGKGHLLSLPTNILNQICSQINRNSLKIFASTCNYSFSFIKKGLLTGSFSVTDLRLLKSTQLYSKLMKEYQVLESFNQSSTFKINSEASTLLFFLYLKKNMANLKRRIKITNLSIGPMRKESIELFEECLTRGLNITRLRIDLRNQSESLKMSLLELKNLRELVLDNYTNVNSDDINTHASNLEYLIINGDEGNRTFSHCKQLKCLIYPKESNFNSFSSEKIVLANLKYEQSITMRPRPIQCLCLNGSNNTSYSCIDLTQYSYESIKVLHLEGITLNSAIGVELIKSSCWNNLECLRMTRVMLQNPQKDLNWILMKCPKELKILELVSLPLSGLNDFNTNENGIWLIDLIFKQFPKLEHLILGDLTLGPSANNLLIKSLLNKKLKRLKVFGLIKIQTIGYNFDHMYQTFRLTYPWSLILINDRQYIDYCEEFNLFKNGKIFLTI